MVPWSPTMKTLSAALPDTALKLVGPASTDSHSEASESGPASPRDGTVTWSHAEAAISRSERSGTMRMGKSD